VKHEKKIMKIKRNLYLEMVTLTGGMKAMILRLVVGLVLVAVVSAIGDGVGIGSGSGDSSNKVTVSDVSMYTGHDTFLKSCYDKLSTELCDRMESHRLERIRNAPSVPLYTDTGYKITKIPEEAMKIIGQFHERNRWIRSTMDVRNLEYMVYNFWDHRSKFIDISMSRRYHHAHEADLAAGTAVEAIMEEWLPSRPIPFGRYGVRMFQPGAIIAPREYASRFSDQKLVSIMLQTRIFPSSNFWVC
jgi:hypothetical protein